ncbi:MAG: hypothetical protein RJA70_1201 [Pseudomonadota bacterium]|jgi:dTMP kinase
MSSGRFIVLEGIDGSGTTTQARLLHERLQRAGRLRTRATCEPTTGPIGALIRHALQRRMVVNAEGGARAPDWKTMALLFAADRMDHNDALILPALARGEIVVSDRYSLSSLAYQSLTSDDPIGALPWLSAINSRAVRPDLTLVLDIDAALATKRRLARAGEPEIFEVDALQARLAERYLRAESLCPGDVIVHLDAAQSVEALSAQIWAVVQKVLPSDLSEAQ